MDLTKLRITKLSSREEIKKFHCGERTIDKWAREKCWKYHDKFRSITFVAKVESQPTVQGFYSLSFSSEISQKLVKGTDQEKYSADSNAPLVYIEYLAVLRSVQGNGIGRYLLFDAILRSYKISQNIAFYGLALRSLNERTQKFYRSMGFVQKEDDHMNPLMVLPIWTIQDLIEGR